MFHPRNSFPSDDGRMIHLAHVALVISHDRFANCEFKNSVLKKIGDREVLVPGNVGIAFQQISTTVLDYKAAMAFKSAVDEIKDGIARHSDKSLQENQIACSLLSSKLYETVSVLHRAVANSLTSNLPVLQGFDFKRWDLDEDLNDDQAAEELSLMVSALQKRNGGLPCIYVTPDPELHGAFLNNLKRRGLTFRCFENGAHTAPRPGL